MRKRPIVVGASDARPVGGVVPLGTGGVVTGPPQYGQRRVSPSCWPGWSVGPSPAAATPSLRPRPAWRGGAMVPPDPSLDPGQRGGGEPRAAVRSGNEPALHPGKRGGGQDDAGRVDAKGDTSL